MIKVLVGDDHAIVRGGLRQLLAETADIRVTGEAGTGPEVLQAALKGEYDVVLLDITMPGRNGLDVLVDLKRVRPALHVLILSMHPEEQYAVRALRAGASGYLTKESAPDELISAIRRVHSGKKYVSLSLAERLASALGAQEEKRPEERLSDREYQVLRMIGSGKSVKQIAEELSLSVKTVSTYRTRLLEKMRMKTTADLIHYAVKQSLVD